MTSRLKLFFICLIISVTSFSQQSPDSTSINLFDLSFTELLDLKVSTANKKEEEISRVPASVVIVDRNEIERYGYQTLEDILQNVTGLYMTDDYYWLGTVHYGVRGFHSSSSFNSIMILVNGVNQNEEYSRGTPLSKLNIPVEAIDKIEIVRGPMSVMYGSGAFLGAINIITNEEESNEVGIMYGSNNSVKAHFITGRTLGNLKYQFNFGVYHTDGLDIPYTEFTSNDTNNTGLTLLERNGLSNNATTHGHLEQTRRHFSLNVAYNDFKFDISHAGSKNGMMDGQPTIGEGTYFINNSTIVHGNYTKAFSSGLGFQLKETYSSYIDYINYEQVYLNTTMGSTQISSFIESEALLTYSINRIDVQAGYINRVVPEYHWGGNYSYWGDNFDNFLTRIDAPIWTNAGFLQTTLNLSKIEFIAGVRAEYVKPYSFTRYVDHDDSVIVKNYKYEYNNINLIPRFATIYHVNTTNVFKLMYGSAIKQPAMADLHPYAFNPDWDILEPSKVSTLELNYINNYSNWLTINTSIFYNSINNLITRKDVFNPDGSLTIESTNGGEIKSIGTEFTLKTKISQKLIIDVSFSNQTSEDHEEHIDEHEVTSYSPSWLGYFKGSYLLGNNFVISLIGRYVDGMSTYFDITYIDPTNTALGKNGRIAPSVPAYTVLDFNFRANQIWKGLFIELNVNNLLDTEIRYPTTTANQWMDKGSLGSPRSIYLSTGFEF